MSRHISIGGHKETFPTKYLKVVSAIFSTTTIAANTAETFDVSSAIPTPYTAADVVAVSMDGYAVNADWNTRLVCIDYPSATKVTLVTVGATSQWYAICLKFFVIEKAQDSY